MGLISSLWAEVTMNCKSSGQNAFALHVVASVAPWLNVACLRICVALAMARGLNYCLTDAVTLSRETQKILVNVTL